jgi:putative ABC transport system permease protein
MTVLKRLAGGIQGLFRRSKAEAELDEELRGYIATAASEKMKAGLDRERALREARMEMGSIDAVKEEVRAAGWESLMETFWQDLRFSARILRLNPGFTTVAVLTLALGIGANTAIFSVVNGVLLRPLAFRDPQRLFLIREIVPQLTKFYPSFPANLPNFRSWQKECHSFEQIAIVDGTSKILTGLGPAEQIHGGQASTNLFDVLGIQPALGRTFRAEEDLPGKDHVAILTDSFWRRRLQGDPGVVGKKITLNGQPFEVVGVLPASFHYPKALGALVEFDPDLAFFKPLGLDPNQFSPMGEFDFAAIARLKPNVTPEQALAELNVIQAQIAQQAKQGMDLRAELLPLESEVVGSARRGLIFLLAAVGSVLLIVCVNLANLLLARIPGRMREAAIRVSLGATRGRLMRQMLTESFLLSLLGSALGVWLASFGARWLVQAAPVSLPRLEEVTLDVRALLFAAILAVVTGAVFGILPAWRIARVELNDVLKAEGRSATENRNTRKLRESLIGLEVALSTVLLMLAGLLTASLMHLLRVDSGFTAEQVLAADLQLPPQNYASPAARQRLYDSVLAGVRAIPGVTSAGWISLLPLRGQASVSSITLPGEQRTGGESPLANYRVVSPGYFETMRIPLIEGRDFAEQDRTRSVAVLSESLAKRFWPGRSPIGQICITEWGGQHRSEVIGVVGDIRALGLDAPPLSMVYLPNSHAEALPAAPAAVSIVLRTARDPKTAATAVRDVIQRLDNEVPILALRPMTQILSESVESRRFQMLLTATFAICALLLASLGIFGVVAYSVEQRRHELGIRLALGALASDMRRLVIGQAMTPVVVGLLPGIALAVITGRLMGSLLFGVTAFDPTTAASVVLVVIVTAVAACWIPARRASKVDPIIALRHE